MRRVVSKGSRGHVARSPSPTNYKVSRPYKFRPVARPKMAKPSGSDGGLTLLVIAVCALGVLAFYAAMIALYLVPALLLIGWFYYLASPAPPDFEVPDPNAYDDPQAVQRILVLQEDLTKCSQERDEIYSENMNVIPLTAASEYTRFDGKYGASFGLNARLDQLEHALTSIYSESFELAAEVSDQMPEWESDLARWATVKAARFSLAIGLGVYVGTAALTLLYEGFMFQVLPYSLNQVLLWASGVSFVATCALWRTKRDQLISSIPQTAFEEWRDLRTRWSVSPAEQTKDGRWCFGTMGTDASSKIHRGTL